MSLSARLSYVKLRNAQDIESAELVLDGSRHSIPKRRGIFSLSFQEPLAFVTEQLSLLVGRKKSRFGFAAQTVFESTSISSVEILSTLLRQRVQKKNNNKVSLTLGVLSITFGVSWQANPAVHKQQGPNDPGTSAHKNHEDLQPTTEGLIKQCPRFRILVIGKSGVGCSTLINRVFGVETGVECSNLISSLLLTEA
ncbi:hypothetical protein EDC04DRAFT_1028763 [Pisolithus marmoratus]|nr:hypothetical protein EDC04DRAFT_1028763 [Pisolithus marmoratus]